MFLSGDSKELFEQRFMKVFDQNQKHVEVRNQRTGTPADFTVPLQDCQKQPREVFFQRTIPKNFAISTGNTCVGVCFLKICRPLDLQLFKKRLHHRCFPVNIAKFLVLPILKNICKQLLFNIFNDSLLRGPKGLRSRLYDDVRLQGPSHRSSFFF